MSNETNSVIRRDIIKEENGTYSVVVVFTNNKKPFWHTGFAAKAEAVNWAEWS